ncbi:nucleoside hydrolase [Auricularia subglabra TFB-10046 SS5]|nr:nucleoside hydrolase [Auricularia subglabra TFB-10046 SS5]
MAHKVIFDTDPGVDDVLALLLLLASPDVQLEAITVTFGNTDLDHAYNNVLKIYDAVQRHCDRHPEDARRFEHLSARPRAMLSRGASGPIEGSLELAEYFHGDDGLSNISTTHVEYGFPQPFESPWISETSKDAPDVILEVLSQEPPGTVTLLAVGPLTNIARAYAKDAATLSRARRIVSMGGTFEAPGNTSPVAEFNVFADPHAAHVVFSASPTLPLLLVPLDITSRHTLPFSALIHESPSALLPALISTVLARPRRVLADLGYTGDVIEMHDPLAAYFVVKHAAADNLLPGWKTVWRTFLTERTGEHTRGMLVVDRR